MQLQRKPLIILLGTLFAPQAFASGYHFGTQSVNMQSTANSATAEANNASTIAYNPAGLSHLPSHQISGSLNFVAPYIKHSDAKAQYYRGGEVSGSDSGKITKDVTIAPHLYGNYKVNDKVSVGIGMYVPFASATQYDADSKLRYNLNQMSLTSVALEPVVSFKPSEKHSVGVGLVAQYSKAKLRKHADWSAASSDAMLTMAAPTLAAVGIPAAAATNRAAYEGHGNVKGDDWGFGYHLGWMYDINDKARVGASYRSKIKHDLKGTAKWEADGVVANALYETYIGLPTTQRGSIGMGRGYVPTEGASVQITTPESASVHGMVKATDKLNLYGDVTWTRHSRFKTADLMFENPKATPKINELLREGKTEGTTSNVTTLKPNWRNTFKVAVGGSYQLSHPLQIRAGIAFDQSPVRNAQDRLNSLPDGNRVWFSAGIKYDFNKNHSIDAAYSHIHINDTRYESQAASGFDTDSKGASSANFKNYANIVGLQYSYQF